MTLEKFKYFLYYMLSVRVGNLSRFSFSNSRDETTNLECHIEQRRTNIQIQVLVSKVVSRETRLRFPNREVFF